MLQSMQLYPGSESSETSSVYVPKHFGKVNDGEEIMKKYNNESGQDMIMCVSW
jgi:hypothetical protein